MEQNEVDIRNVQDLEFILWLSSGLFGFDCRHEV